jgi:tetratricopeptide (TPR) repeat protein
LFSDLYPSKLLDVVPDDKVTEVFTELDLLETDVYTTQNLEDIAGRTGGSHILKGILTRAGESFRVDITLQEATGMTVIAAERVSGASENDFYSMVNELTLKIKVALNLSDDQIAGDIDEDVEGITTKSPEALKLYGEGRKYYWSDPQKSVELVEKAVEIDPEFAMAYRSLWVTYRNQLRDVNKARKYREKALEFADRVSLRERLYIRYLGTPDLNKRLELAEEMFGIYPDDILMRNNLAGDMMVPELFDKSAALLEPLVEKRKRDWLIYDRLAWIYIAMGQYGKAENIAKIYKQEIAQKDEFFWALAYAYAAQGKKDLAFSELEKMEELPKSLDMCNWIGWLYVALEDELEAERIFRRIFDFENKAAHLEAWVLLADLSLLQGKVDRAEEQWKEGLKLAEEMQAKGWIRQFHVLSAILELRRGNTKEALETIEKYGFNNWIDGIEIYAATMQFGKAEELVEKLREGTENTQSLYHKTRTRYLSRAEGYIALGKEDYAGAAAHFQKAQSLLPYPYPPNMDWYPRLFEPLALAYYKSGDLEKAQEEFEKITKMTLGRVCGWDIYAKSFYMLGKIAEQRGWPGKAIEHYERFLEVWKDADSDIAEIEEAKKRLTSLKSN